MSTAILSPPAARNGAARDDTTFTTCLATSERIGWRVEDLIGGSRRLDFSRRFLPEDLARVERLPFLDQGEKRLLNQIRAHGYLRMFVTIEAVITPIVLQQAAASLGDDVRARALLAFASEEAKHTHLFNVFTREFARGFGTRCDTIGPHEEIAAHIAGHHPLGVGLFILMAEWVSQAHYLQGCRDRDLDPVFCDMLKHHWMEEAQHARLDTVLVQELAARLSPAEVKEGVEDLFRIGDFVDGGLVEQVGYDLDALQRAGGRRLSAPERESFRAGQLAAQRWTFMGSGMLHPRFLETVASISPEAARRLAEAGESMR